MLRATHASLFPYHISAMISSDDERDFVQRSVPIAVETTPEGKKGRSSKCIEQVPETPEYLQGRTFRGETLSHYVDVLSSAEKLLREDAYDCVGELNAEHFRQVYLVTYARADEKKVGSREQFVEMLVNEFGTDRVVKWVCCAEPHCDSGFHYHCVVKLVRVLRWKSVKNRLRSDPQGALS
jgi:hypothetical protein